MAEKKRTLSAPTYTKGSADPTASAQRAAEAAEQGVDPTQEPSGPNRRQRRQERRRQRRNAPHQQRKRYAREQSRQARQDALDADIGDPIARLRQQTRAEQAKFMSSIRKSGIVSEGQSKPTQKRKLSDLQSAYASMMVLHCLSPLQRGVSAQSVMSVVGMGTMMTMLSPNFRAQVGDYIGQIGPAISNAIDKRVENSTRKKGEAAREKLDKFHDRTGGDRDDVRGLAGRRLRKRLAKIENMERGYREPFTDQSAALAHVGIVQSAYDEMRAPGADRKAIKDRYDTAMSALYEYIEDDGLDQTAVERNVRVITGQLLERDPTQASAFSELGHGQFIKNEPKEFYLPGDTQPTRVWTGDFTDSFGGNTVNGGAFTLREPMSAYEHRVASSKAIYGEMLSSSNLEEFNGVVEQYLVASATREYPEAVEYTDDPLARSRMSRARTMFSSMADDGLSAEDQKLVYMGSYLDAMNMMSETHPEIGRLWAEKFGENWQERMSEMVQDYSDLGEEAMEREQAGADVDEPMHNPGPRFTGTQDGPIVDAESDVVDGEFVDDDPESSVSVDDKDIVDAEVVEDEPVQSESSETAGSVKAESSVTSGSSHDDQQNAVDPKLEAVGVRDDEALQSMIADGVAPERATSGGLWQADRILQGADSQQWRTSLVEDMSDHMAMDILQSAHNPQGEGADEGSWTARHVWRSRARALGKLDPNRASIRAEAHDLTGNSPQGYAEEIRMRRREHRSLLMKGETTTVSPDLEHTPWGPDVAANTRAREMAGMAYSMSDAKVSAGDQDVLHSVAYVRALEKVVAVDPSYEAVVQRMVEREGGSRGDWRRHEFSGSLDRSRSRTATDYDRAVAGLELTPVAELDNPIPSSAREPEETSHKLRESKAPDSEVSLDLRRTSRKNQAARQNMWANGADVRSGRFSTEVDKPLVPENSEPQPGL